MLEYTRKLVGALLGCRAVLHHVLKVRLHLAAQLGLLECAVAHGLLHLLDCLAQRCHNLLYVAVARLGKLLLSLLEHLVGSALHLCTHPCHRLVKELLLCLGGLAVSLLLCSHGIGALLLGIALHLGNALVTLGLYALNLLLCLGLGLGHLLQEALGSLLGICPLALKLPLQLVNGVLHSLTLATCNNNAHEHTQCHSQNNCKNDFHCKCFFLLCK